MEFISTPSFDLVLKVLLVGLGFLCIVGMTAVLMPAPKTDPDGNLPAPGKAGRRFNKIAWLAVAALLIIIINKAVF